MTEFVKRLFDVAFSAGILIVASPLMLLLALAVRVFLGSPIFFTQLRPGLHGKPFRMVKFRTMLAPANGSGAASSDADRLTRFGRLLRASSLDELPELWNVLRGDMSLVGPRPLLMQYLERYSAEQARRHLVRPGLTGWAQVNGRNALDWDEKLAMDVWYVDNRSFLLDLKILAMTVLKVVRAADISASGSATMPEFLGGPARAARHETSGPARPPLVPAAAEKGSNYDEL